MYRTTLFLASLLTTSQAWVKFPGADSSNPDPWAKPTPKNLQQIEAYSPIPAATSEERSISTIPTFTTVPVPTHSEKPFVEWVLELVKRQGGAAVANPAAAQPTGNQQVSPVTIYTIRSKGEIVSVPYTQTFPSVNEQWPSPSKGTIGLGTIQGQVGIVKTKRSEPATDAPATPTPTSEHESRGIEEEVVQVLEARADDGASEDGVFDEEGGASSSDATGLLVSTSTALAASAFAFMLFL